MSSETRKITMSERFYWAVSEISGAFDKIKRSVASYVNEGGLCTALKNVLGSFGKIKKAVFLEVPEDQVYESWRGVSKGYSCKFSVIPEPGTTVLLYQDGKSVSLNGCGAIYPFSSDPQKKNPFWKKSAASVAEVVCIRAQSDINVFWGTPRADHIAITDENTKKSFGVLAYGQLQLQITDAKLLYEKLLRNRRNTEELQDVLRNQFINNTRGILNGIFANITVPSGDSGSISTSCQIELNEKYYEATKGMFKEFGLEVNERTKYTILKGITIKSLEPQTKETVPPNGPFSLFW